LHNCSISYISEIQLIMNYKDKGKNTKITYGFADLFLFDNNIGNDCVVIELKLFNLIGLYSGKQNKWERYPNHNSLIELDNEIKEESEENLLNRNYMYWCKDEEKSKTSKISRIINQGYEQLLNYMKVICKGKVCSGVCLSDNRISVKGGLSFVRGYLVASFGSQRIIVRSVVYNSNFQYFKETNISI
jgi:hypothetical protein